VENRPPLSDNRTTQPFATRPAGQGTERTQQRHALQVGSATGEVGVAVAVEVMSSSLRIRTPARTKQSINWATAADRLSPVNDRCERERLSDLAPDLRAALFGLDAVEERWAPMRAP
jgi:hypothetical protein